MAHTPTRRCSTPDSMDPACMLCHRVEADPDICGAKLISQLTCAHHFCLLFATDLNPRGTQEEDQMIFSSMEIIHTVFKAAQMICSVCGEWGATITCQEMGCERRFHLPCAVEGECVTRYQLPYSSFCWEHRPRQQELAAPEDTSCVICMDPVEGRTSYGTMVCPACKNAWFHRACIQGQAMRSGAFSLKCPLCQDKRLFLTEMLLMGIRIPVRQASWEDDNAYGELYQRHSSCDASKCLCPEGRGLAEPEGPWQLLLCSSCAAVGTHRRCSKLENSHEATWECDSCAGLGTSSRASSELAAPSTAGPAASEQSPGSLERELSSTSSSSSQASLGQTRRCSTTRQQAPAASPCSAPQQRRRSNRPSGPMRVSHRSRAQHRDQAPYARPRRGSRGRRTPAAQAGRSPRRQAASRLSQGSPARASSCCSSDSQESSGSSSSSTDSQEAL